MELGPEDRKKFYEEQDSFFEKATSSNLNPLSIFLAVLAALLVAWFLKSSYEEWQAREALRLLNLEFAKMQQQTQVEVQRMQTNLYNQRVAAEERSRISMEKIRLENEARRQIEREKILARKNEIDQINRRNRNEGWATYYQPSKDCDSSNQYRDNAKCTNEELVAMRDYCAAIGGC